MIASGLQIYVVEEFSCRQLALSLIRPNMPRNVVMRTNLTNQMRLVSDYQRNEKKNFLCIGIRSLMQAHRRVTWISKKLR